MSEDFSAFLPGERQMILHPAPSGAGTCYGTWRIVPEWERVIAPAEDCRLVICGACQQMGVVALPGQEVALLSRLCPGAVVTEDEGKLTVTLPGPPAT